MLAAMLFLMNDDLIELDARGAVPPIAPQRFRALSLEHVLKLGAEMFAEQPLLHREAPERARRLALLIRCKAPEVNAALFSAPGRGCPSEEVVRRLAEVSLEVMANLYTRWSAGALDPVAADRDVWRRMAA